MMVVEPRLQDWHLLRKYDREREREREIHLGAPKLKHGGFNGWVQ
jgi:hypothetical protein